MRHTSPCRSKIALFLTSQNHKINAVPQSYSPETRKKVNVSRNKLLTWDSMESPSLAVVIFNIIIIVVWSAARKKPNPCTVHWSFQKRTSGRSRRKRKRSAGNCFFFLVCWKHAYPCMFHISNSKQLLYLRFLIQ